MRLVCALLALATFAAAGRAQDLTLDQIRKINLDRAANMPAFVADETDAHYTAIRNAGSSTAAPRWRHDHTFTAEIVVRGAQVNRRNVFRDGSRWTKTAAGHPDVMANMPAAGFGASLQALFDARCPTTLMPAEAQEMRGKPVLVYRFSSPANGCFGDIYGAWAYNAPRTGRVLIDSSSGEVFQFEEEATGFPPGLGYIQRNQIMAWNTVRIGNTVYWLPVSAEFNWKREDGTQTRSVVEYKNHRHFDAETNFLVK